jgi:hypothetical protein
MLRPITLCEVYNYYYEQIKISLLMFLAYLYGLVKSYIFIDRLFKYTQSGKDIQVFILEGSSMVPWNLSETKYSADINSMTYVILNINGKEKILVFNNRTTLRLQYPYLKKLVADKSGHFGHYMEVIKDNNEDIVELFNKYDDSDNTFFCDITKYSLKARDIYDFKHHKFLLEPNSILEVVKMDLSSTKYNYNDIFINQHINFVKQS